MNGAQSLVATFLASGLDTCFTNPGTSEMHFVAALDDQPDMRCVLCLFEGGASGAADAYHRMSGKVAATLLHLAPGFGNAFANLHNARKAGAGVLNVVGDHATYHLGYESPLRGDVAGVSGAISHSVITAQDAGGVAADGSRALRAARMAGGQISTLILPADTAWGDGGPAATAAPPPALPRPDPARIAAAVHALRQDGAALMVGGPALHGPGLQLAGRVAQAAGATLMAPLLVGRIGRGAGTPPLTRQAYVVEENVMVLGNTRAMVLVGADRPVSFFAYPGKPSLPEPPDCAITDLCPPGWDVVHTLEALADALGASAAPQTITQAVPDIPEGPLTQDRVGRTLAALMPDGAIVVDEGITSSRGASMETVAAAPHDWLHTPGGAIGGGLPNAVGAAVACPDRPVIALTGDGSAMYTIQSLWTMANERLNVVIIVFANRGYQILRLERMNLGLGKPGPNAMRMFDVMDPDLDWQAMARAHGVASARAEDCAGFADALRTGLKEPGPFLIEAVV
ncbi:MAG: acetolactate synthase large subunit [Pseudomonadota bacterium]